MKRSKRSRVGVNTPDVHGTVSRPEAAGLGVTRRGPDVKSIGG